MGKKIVTQESPRELGKHSRLQLVEAIIQVLEDNTLSETHEWELVKLKSYALISPYLPKK